ncbi:hypothetical protein F511_22994 [Dorcoceras hygrometricum]|uniref:Dystroglycan-like n=1 Tax=Dorcoceras hygrometricum TaxID=472368 RepID=A0A2Z7BBK6_9LAMI|nr:hypothetical protein F511_22994 [Dorcoceras hygrometricum]
MDSSLYVNTFQVDFKSVLTMEHAGMVRMFKTLEDTELHGFLEGNTPIFESAVVEFFSNARVIAGTIVSTVFGQNLMVTEEFFSGTFKLPTEGMQNFSGIPNEKIAEMRTRFSATIVPFQSSGKKKDLHFEYRLLHDIVAKSLYAKAGSFDKITCEKFEVMVAISAGLSANWGRILFQRLLTMVQNPRKLSQGFTVQINILMELLVRADLETATKLHVKKVLTRKQVENYIKTNQGINPTEETASNTEGGMSQQVPPEVSKSLADATEKNMPNPKKRKHKGGATKKQTKQAATQITTTPPDTTVTKFLRIEKLWFQQMLILRRIRKPTRVLGATPMQKEAKQLLECAQTEDITELSERWSLILYKLLETELENLYLAHLANFKTNVVSTHRDFECIAPVNCCCT